MNATNTRNGNAVIIIRLIVIVLLAIGFISLLETAYAEDEIIDKHDPYKHAKESRFTQEYGPNSVFLCCDWEHEDLYFGKKHVCQFQEWPLLFMSRPDERYDGQPKEAYFGVQLKKNFPYYDYEGFPYEYAEWDGKFIYTGINGTVEYGPTDKAPIGEGTYYVYCKVKIPSAKSITSSGTFILGKTFTIEPSDYDLKYDANVPDNASTKDKLTGAMPTQHFASAVQSQQLAPNQFRLPGYTFDSWNTKPDGKGTKYANNAIVKGLSKGWDTVLYAQWKPLKYDVIYGSGEAGNSSVREEALFDQPVKLKAVSDFGWSYPDHSFLGWKTIESHFIFHEGGMFINLCGEPSGYYGEIKDVDLVAQWAGNGQIIVVVTEDGRPKSGLEDDFRLKKSTGETYTMNINYSDGRYIFDPSEAHHGGVPGALPPGEYEFWLENNSYPKVYKDIVYDGRSPVSVVMDYYTVGLEADPAYKDVHQVQMTGVQPDEQGRYVTVVSGNEKLELKTTVSAGYHFDGYSASGVAPLWEDGSNMKAVQTIKVQGQADIMAHVEANNYKVKFDPNSGSQVIGKMEEQDMVYDEPQQLFANTFVRSGAEFTGWNTRADGKGTAYKNKQSVKNLTKQNGGIVTLYAQWKNKPVKTALLTFDLKGGSLKGMKGKVTVREIIGSVIKMPQSPNRSGYIFKYWKGSKYNPGDKYKVTGKHTFTAVWEKAGGPFITKIKAKKKGLIISWNKVKGADGYTVYFARCSDGNKVKACRKVKTVKNGKPLTWKKSGLKKGTAYKAYVKAYVLKNGKKKNIKTSPVAHAYTGNGNKKYTNARSIKVSKTKVTLKKGKTFRIKAKVKRVNKNKKLMPKSHAPKLRFKSSNSKIAKVSGSGRIKAVKKGTCTICVFAHNGVSKTIKVRVK